MNLQQPKHNIPIVGKMPMNTDWFKFITRLVGSTETSNPTITASATISKIGFLDVDCTAGAITITPQAFPVTIMKADGTANAITIGGITVNGNASFSWNTQYEAWTIVVTDDGNYRAY